MKIVGYVITRHGYIAKHFVTPNLPLMLELSVRLLLHYLKFKTIPLPA